MVLFLCLIVYLNIRLYNGPHLENRKETIETATKQLNFLGNELHNNDLGQRMQGIFPEGFVFTNVLYGLSCAELAIGADSEDNSYINNLEEARFAFNEINSAYAKQNFIKSMSPEYGMYYSGWNNYLLGKILSAQKNKDSAEIRLFETNCSALAKAFLLKESPFVESYPVSSWPADAAVGIASLKLHDLLFEPKYDTLITQWIQKVRFRVDTSTGIIPHETDPVSGMPIGTARGSSICLTLIFLSEIDQEFAREQFELFYENFTIKRFGLTFIREYPKNSSGRADIDSGPVILKVGFAGTIVSTGTFLKFGEVEIANKISACIESISFPKTSEDQKIYLSGSLPVADAFIVWSRLQFRDPTHNNYSYGSFLIFHFYSFLVLLLFVIIFYRKKILYSFNNLRIRKKGRE